MRDDDREKNLISAETDSVHQDKILKLLEEFDIHRDEIKSMISDLEKIRQKIERLIPETLDMRYIRLLEEKVKTVTNLFNSLLEMRKEISKSVKDEIEIRRKIVVNNEMINVDEMLDIRSVVDTIEDFKEKTSKLRRDRYDKTKEQKYDENIEIPGITTKEKGE